MNVFSSRVGTVLVGAAAIALLSGTAGAIGATMITGAQIKNESVTGSDIKDGTLKTADIADRSLLARDFKAGQLPAGPRGLKGDQGVKGDDGADGISGWQIVNALQDVPSHASATASAVCPSNKKVFGGGHQIGGAAGDLVVSKSAPVASTNSFDATATNSGTISRTVRTWAICAVAN